MMMFGAFDMYGPDKNSHKLGAKWRKGVVVMPQKDSYQLVHQIGLSALIKEEGILKGSVFTIHVRLNHVLTMLPYYSNYFISFKLSVTENNATDFFYLFNVCNTE